MFQRLRNFGMADPEDLAMLQTLLDDHFAKVALSNDERERIARELLQLFKAGMRDRGSLLAELAGRTPSGGLSSAPGRDPAAGLSSTAEKDF